MTNFAEWTQENLAKFAQEANDKIIDLNKRLEQRQWVRLTDKEVRTEIDSICQYAGCYEEVVARKIEAKLKEKNCG